MKVKIIIEHNGKTFEGILYPTETLRTISKEKELVNTTNNPYNKNSTKWFLYKLIFNDKFFEKNKIRTTQEVVNRIWIKYRKKVLIKNAIRDFQKVVEDGYLEKEYIKPSKKLPRGAYLWFSPSTTKETIDAYKKSIQDGEK